MQSWFRFSGRIALVSLLSSGFALIPAASAQEQAENTKSQQEAADAAADADTALEGFDPHDLPTPRKHQLRPTPLQIANHRIMRLNERLVTQNNRVGHLESIISKQEEKLAAQEEAFKALQEAQTKADARLQAMFDQIATVSRQVEGIESLRTAHATRSARAAQQALRGAPPSPGAGPSVQHNALSGEAPVPRAIPVAPPPAPAKPEPTVLPPPEGSTLYEVRPGDNLTRIARAHGTTVAEILKFNKITDERKLQIGQELHIPPGDTVQPTVTPSPEAEAGQP